MAAEVSCLIISALQAYDNEAGLAPNAEIVAVNGMREDMNTREFLTWFKMNFNDGDEITLTVKKGGKEDEITYRLPRS